MARPAWYAYSGIINRRLSETVEVISTEWEVFDRAIGRVVATFGNEADAVFDAQIRSRRGGLGRYEVQQVQSTVTNPASQRGVALIPLSPLPIFKQGGTVLATRGFWDVQSKTVPAGIVSTFAFGLCFLPVGVVFDINPLEKFPFISSFTVRRDPPPPVPDPLLDDIRWFCYDSFVRVTTDVNQDPPFYSKSKRKFGENECLCAVISVEVQVANLQSLSLQAGIRFRVLIQS